MSSSLRCRITGCDLDPCGICRRCGDEQKASHQWEDAESDKPCFKLKVCSRCGKERKSPSHDWQPAGETAAGEPSMKCSRCGLAI